MTILDSLPPTYDFPRVVSSTSLATLKLCQRKWNWSIIHGYSPKSSLSVDLHAGKCWASALEVTRNAYYRDGLLPDEAISLGLIKLNSEYGDFECPAKSPKSASRLSDAFIYYFTAFHLETDAVRPYLGSLGPMVEFSFTLPLPVLHPTTNEPILYSGRADMIGEFANGLYIFDDKTTTSLGNSWASKWNLRSQFSSYCWAAREYGIPVTGAIVRGISILKTTFDHAQVITQRPPYLVDEWLQSTTYHLNQAIDSWRKDYFPPNFDDACTSYGVCPFETPCSAPSPTPWLESMFHIRHWNPITREMTDENGNVVGG